MKFKLVPFGDLEDLNSFAQLQLYGVVMFDNTSRFAWSLSLC